MVNQGNVRKIHPGRTTTGSAAALVMTESPHRGQNKTGEDEPRRLRLRNAFVTFVANWCKRFALRFSSLRYLTLS